MEALRNAVLNSATDASYDENIKTIFFSRIDQISLIHLQYLKEIEVNPGSVSMSKLPDELKKQLYKDLENFGFIKAGFGFVGGIPAAKLTWIGQRFLNFIRFKL